jgi:hypothetical protein
MKGDGTAMTIRQKRWWSGAATSQWRIATARCSSGPGQCCVVPVGAEHRAASRAGAEIILFQNGQPI